MRIINAFVAKDSFISNEPGQVSEFFELSPLALTFSRTRGEYQSDLSTDLYGDTLHVFDSFVSDTNEHFVLAQGIVNHILTITSTIFTYCHTNIGNFTLADLRNYVATLNAATIQNFALGLLYEGENYTLPDWVSWTHLSPDGTQTNIRVWYRNEAFENQYSNFEIIVVPPLSPIDNFFNHFANVGSQLSQATLSVMVDRAQEAKQGIPESYMRILTFKFYNSANQVQFIETHWPVLIYGKNGDNIDSIKDAIIDYISKNSSRTQNDWQTILPDIFRRTEFMIFPRWDKVSIANLTDLSSLYSSIFSPREMLQFISNHHPAHPGNAFIEEKTRVIPFDYKAIVCAFIPGSNNADGVEAVEQLFPDYIPVGTSDLDFNRMSQTTREWVIMMVGLIKAAETTNEFSTVISPMRRVIRNGKLFLSRIYNNVNYLVSVRSNNLS